MPPPRRTNNFQVDWVRKKEFCTWLTSVRNSSDKAHCKLCKKNFDVGNMGISAVNSHMQSAKHRRISQKQQDMAATQNTLNVTVMRASSANADVPQAMTASSSVTPSTSVVPADPTVVSTVGTKKDLTSFVHKDDVTKAEILWALKTVMANYSYNSSAGLNELLRVMFPDSEIAKKFQLGSTKIGYIIRHGLAPYFSAELQSEAKQCEHFVLAFDESLNKVSQHGQMDVHIRFYDKSGGKVSTRYFGSQFLGHATADDLVRHFVECMKDLNYRNLIQISMDGPSVNWSFIEKLKNQLERDPGDPVLLELGSCSLHVVHGAFQTGGKASGFDVSHLLTSLYYLFKDSPARREDYTNMTASSTFPLKFLS